MEKKSGFLLLFFGVALILGGVWLMLSTIYRGAGFPQPFDMDAEITVALPKSASVTIPLPPQINRAANTGVFFLMIFVLLGAGARIGSLGIKLIHGPGEVSRK